MTLTTIPPVYRSTLPPSNQIAYLQGDGNYTRVLLLDGRALLFGTTLSRMQRQHWPEFIRVHKSYAVNPKAVSGLSTSDPLAVEVGILGQGSQLVTTVAIPVARRRKLVVEQLMSLINTFEK